MNLPSTAFTTMDTTELLGLVNEARAAFGEGSVRHNDFVARCKDELDGEHYESFVVQNLNNTQSEGLRLTADQCKLVAMRESKGVRRHVLARLNELEGQQTRPMTQAEITAANANHLVAVERQQREQQAALERIERRVEDLSQTTVWDHCPQNCQSLTRIKETMLKRHGLSGAVVDYVLKVWPNQPNPAGMVRNGHEEALGSQYLVWSKSHVTAAFHRFVSESTMVTATQATHPYFDGRFRLVQKVPQ
ncbi:phage antirepressor [Pseudomonas fulva]|uniref:phage antirepressor n=1 Tax=Pseudomonas fulva TaxID=47880 RepID=UPI000F792E86|nr:phage antirepressor [Pseudomonas fulva]MBA1217244.1 phage antirepressor [Pseudomonas fulva]MDH0571016.1 phage antirepressor [Pseudomonas fulva]RRW63220.1 phage antirepressor [Pseudomonas fulva]